MNERDLFIGCIRKEPTPAEVRSLAERLTQPVIRLSRRRALRDGESPEFPPMGGESFPPLGVPTQRSNTRRCPCCGR